MDSKTTDPVRHHAVEPRSLTMIAAGTENDVRAMYEAYPYPSSLAGESLIDDVANLLSCLFPDGIREGVRILDAGCGSAHRLVRVARQYPKAEIRGVDISAAALGVAEKLAHAHAVDNIQFHQSALRDIRHSVPFDIIISTGVIHHLETPLEGLRHLSTLLSDEGILIVWLYHSLGEHRRLCDRELFLTLWGRESGARREGIELLRDLGLKIDTKQYGATAAQPLQDEVSQLHIDVDAFMHPIVNAYRFDEAIRMCAVCNLDWVTINGINLVGSSRLIDLSEADTSDFSYFCVHDTDLFDAESLRQRYRRLDRLARLCVIELRLRPTGFTILGGRGRSSTFGPRVEGNVVWSRLG